MFAFITLGTNNLSVSSVFYDNLLRPLGIIKAVSEDRYIGYAKKNIEFFNKGKSEFIKFYLIIPFDKKKLIIEMGL